MDVERGHTPDHSNGKATQTTNDQAHTEAASRTQGTFMVSLVKAKVMEEHQMARSTAHENQDDSN